MYSYTYYNQRHTLTLPTIPVILDGTKTQTKASKQIEYCFTFPENWWNAPIGWHGMHFCILAPATRRRVQNKHIHYHTSEAVVGPCQAELASKDIAIADQWFKSAYSNIPAHFLKNDAMSMLDVTECQHGSWYLPQGVAHTKHNKWSRQLGCCRNTLQTIQKKIQDMRKRKPRTLSSLSEYCVTFPGNWWNVHIGWHSMHLVPATKPRVHTTHICSRPLRCYWTMQGRS